MPAGGLVCDSNVEVLATAPGAMAALILGAWAAMAPLKLHHSPECLKLGGWHDIAGALTHKGVHHVWQGCPAKGAWSHAASTDLVHWEDRGLGPSAIQELSLIHI